MTPEEKSAFEQMCSSVKTLEDLSAQLYHKVVEEPKSKPPEKEAVIVQMPAVLKREPSRIAVGAK